uniref:Xylulose kinase-1 n=1 Tax=Tanacetum cinerariifolium TaxID=118510 RepID=A0A6L2NKS8_TANCI|nr:hypothetical protein [Tanacetum cinerariifolium]
MVAFLSKSDASDRFDQIVDFLNAQVIQYALMVNPTVYVSCIKQFWATTSIKKVNDVVKLQALIDRKKWKFLIHTLVQCVSAKRTAWNEFSCSMASIVIYLATELERVFSRVETPLFASMLVQPQAAEEEADVEVPTAPTPPSPTIEPSPPPQDPITTPLQAQPATPQATPPQEQPTTTSESSMTLLNTLMEKCDTLSQKVAALEQDKIAHALEILKLKKMVKKLERKRRSKSSGLKRLRKVGTSQMVESSTETVMGAQEDASKQGGKIEEIDANEDVTLVDMETQVVLGAKLQGRKDDVNAATKDISDAEPTVFDDEEVTMTMAQTLIKMKAEKARLLDEKYQSLKRKPISIAQAKKNMIIYLKNMAGYKIEHFRGMTYDKVITIFEREYNKVQTLFIPDKDVEEPSKKRVTEETLLQESFKKLKEVVVLGSESTQETPTNDQKEISEEDVKNMLEIVPVSEFKVEALQVKYPLIDWEIHYEGSRSYWKIIRVGGITKAYQSLKTC